LETAIDRNHTIGRWESQGGLEKRKR
jgi:hypothetical protein